MKIRNRFKALFTLSFILIFTLNAWSQSASTNQIGLRLGGYSGITFRHINASAVGIEANFLAGFHGDWAMLSILAEKHVPLGSGFIFFLGGGGFIAGDNDFPDEDDDRRNWDPTVGLEGVLGFDYYFETVPLNLGLDIRPRFLFHRSFHAMGCRALNAVHFLI